MTNQFDEKLRKDILSKIPDMVFTRVPKPTKLTFYDFAKEEFCGDRGMAFKHIWDFYTGLIPKGWEHLELQLEVLTNEINQLKQLVTTNEEKEEFKVMANGVKLPIRK